MKNSPKNTDKLFKTIDAIDKLFAAQQSSVSTAFTTRVSSVKKKMQIIYTPLPGKLILSRSNSNI